ncbi:uncharacterized protein ACR2FA_006360 isoform 2-T2 [Aphomia sociella]
MVLWVIRSTLDCNSYSDAYYRYDRRRRPQNQNVLMITLFYLPVSFYCEWKRKYNNSNMNNVEILDDIRDITMTSIIFPFTVFSDICFWLLWYTDPTLIAPVRIFDYLPHWAQHSLHTVSFLVVILDLLLVPRRRPASLVPAFIMSTAFCTLYYVVISVATLMQCYVYEFLKTITALQWLSLTLFAMLISMIIIYLEWVVIEIVWRPTKYKVKSN